MPSDARRLATVKLKIWCNFFMPAIFGRHTQSRWSHQVVNVDSSKNTTLAQSSPIHTVGSLASRSWFYVSDSPRTGIWAAMWCANPASAILW